MEKDKLVVSTNSVRSKGQKLEIDPKSLALLNLLLRSEWEVPSQDVIDVLENPNLSAAHNIKIKNQVIENLNFRLKTLLEIDHDPIQSGQSEVDKRIKTYRIDSKYFLIR